MTKVMLLSEHLIQLVEMVEAQAMSVRILDMLDTIDDRRVSTSPIVDASLSLFISLKTECICSPMTSEILVQLTGVCWFDLQAEEIRMLCDVGWKLYAGALTTT